MDEIERIRRRVHHTHKNQLFMIIYRMMILFMCAITVVLSGLIVTNTPYIEAKKLLMNYIHNIDLGNILVFENWFLPSTHIVNTEITYQKLDGNYYKNATNMVYAIADGVCVYLDEHDSGYQMIVKNDNNILVTYANLSDVSVKVDDRILMNSVIGSYQEKIYMDFMDGDSFITYEEAIAKD